MVSFDYLIQDEMGLHARPVGLMVKAVKPYVNTKITVRRGEKEADAKRMFAIMGLQVKKGETITVQVEGENEGEVADAILHIFQTEHL